MIFRSPLRSSTVRRDFRGLALLAAAGVLALLGCSRANEAASAKKPRAAVPVVVAKVERRAMPLEINAVGAVESLHSISIRSLVTGLLWKVDFREGQSVKQGDLLFEVDPRPFQNALSLAEADAEKARAQLDTAESQLTRYTNLVAQGLVTQEQFQTARNAERALKAELLSFEAAVATAKLQLEYCFVKAPCDGRTGSLGVHEGDLVRASDANVSLVTITQMAPIYVTFAVPQQNFAAIQQYLAAGKIGVVANPETDAAKGEVTFVDNAMDADTGTIRLKATFPNVRQRLWPGQFVNIRATLALEPDRIVVPSTALQNGQKGVQAFVVRADGTADLRAVTVLRTVGNESVIASGLNAGETVVVDGQIKLTAGAPVTVKPPVVDQPSLRANEVAER